MKPITLWVISGANSIIAREFAKIAAASSANLLLIGRDTAQLERICADIRCRYPIQCEYFAQNFAEDPSLLLQKLDGIPENFALCLAHADMCDNPQLDKIRIQQMIRVNIENSVQLIHQYWQRSQDTKNIIFISSVAAAFGRRKNSLYAACKAALEIYLQGLQQQCTAQEHILIVRAGFIDTRHTFGAPGIFHAAKPEAFAKRVWQANQRKRYRIYYPRFWRGIITVISCLPWFLYKRMRW